MTFNRNQPNYQNWLNHSHSDPQLKQELLEASDSELQAAFGASELEFGTAGIRGIMGPGPARFNSYTVKKVSIALAKYLQAHFPHQITKGVVVGHDNRHQSREFALLVADVLSSFSIPSYLFSQNRMTPTPVVSFATRKLEAVAGVVITASHNPKNYNGYKIYDSSGTQLDEEATGEIATFMKGFKDILDWKFSPNKSLIQTVPALVTRAYNQMLEQLQFYPKMVDSKKELKIVYSGVNGTGNLFVPKILRKFGYQIIDVPEHQAEDPDFTNVGNPNPEFAPAWKWPLFYAEKTHADLVIMTDPDADRIGIAVNDGKNHFVRLNGNETGPLLIDWKLSQQKFHLRLPVHPALYSSVVTSDLGDRIAAETYDAKVIKTLTGFKWMGAEIKLERLRHLNFVFAYEESFGYVLDDATRDKDGIQAAVMASEMAWFHKVRAHQTLLDYLHQLYKLYGYYFTRTINHNVKPEDKATLLDPIMTRLRNTKFRKLGGLRVAKIEDYQQGVKKIPHQNLLKLYFNEGSWIAIRPSGTEPKLKIYFVVVGRSHGSAKRKYHRLKSSLRRKLKIKI